MESPLVYESGLPFSSNASARISRGTASIQIKYIIAYEIADKTRESTSFFYEYHCDLSCFPFTSGRVITVATARATMVSISCTRLKSLLRRSKVLDGDTRVIKRSRPYANTSDVDSRCEGEVAMTSTFNT